MVGALLEAVLLSMIDMYPKEAETAIQKLSKSSRTKIYTKIYQDPRRLTLNDLLYISFGAGWIPYKNATEPKNGELGDWLLNFVKEFRNWVHPGKKIKDYTKMRVTKKRFEAARELVDETINLLLNKVENDLKKEFEKL